MSLLAATVLLSGFPVIGYADNVQETLSLQTEERTNYEVEQIDGEPWENMEVFQMSSVRSNTINSYASTYGKEWIREYYKGNSQKQSEALRFYDLIVAYIDAFQNGSKEARLENNIYYFINRLDVSSFGKNFTEKELEMIYTIILYDHPELYVTDGLRYEVDSNKNIKSVIGICKKDYVKADVRNKLQQEIDKNVQRYLDEVSGLKTDIEKEIAIHNKMLEEVTYAEKTDIQAASAHNIISVLDDDKTTMPVCEGYTKAFQLLLNACGIENIYVVGEGKGQSHAWNLVKLDGAYYYVDVTWDDARYETIEEEYKNENNNVKYTPVEVGEWAKKKGMTWEDEQKTPCTVENTVYYYFNKVGNSFTSEHTLAKPFNLSGDSINQELYGLPALASTDYKNETVNVASHILNYDSNSGRKLTVYNSGIEVKPGTSVAEGTVLTVKFQPFDSTPIYSIYAEGTLVPITKENNEYVGNFSMGSKDITITIESREPEVTGVSLNKNSLSFSVIGNTEGLIATVSPESAKNKNVKWTSDNEKVATVDNTGKVTAIANGTAVITVTTEDGKKTATCKVVVDTKNRPVNVPVTGVSFDRAEIVLYQIPATEYIKANVTPNNATNKKITWSSSNPAVAVVNSAGEVTSVSNGTAVITATTEDGQKTATCTVKVDNTNPPSEIKVTGLVLDKTEVSLTRSGAKETLTATIYPTNATNQKVKWHSDKTSIATVNNGVVTAVRTGTATITATTEDGKFVASCTVTVKIPSSSNSSSGSSGSNRPSNRPSSSDSDKGSSNSGPSSSNNSNSNNIVSSTSKNVWESGTNGRLQYRDASGQYVKDSWAQINGKWYHFGTDTYMQNGWFLDKDGKWYYLDPTNGEMKSGWQKVNNKWYYLNTQSGHMTTKWQKVDNKWYFMDAKTGEMKTQWIWVDSKWYYLDSVNGDMKTGWQRINGKWYYLTESGECLMNTTTPDGKKVDKDGVWIQ